MNRFIGVEMAGGGIQNFTLSLSLFHTPTHPKTPTPITLHFIVFFAKKYIQTLFCLFQYNNLNEK